MTGTVLIAVVLVVVLIMNGLAQKQPFWRDKFLLTLSFLVFLFSLPLALDIHLGGVMEFLNQFFGNLTKMVVRL